MTTKTFSFSKSIASPKEILIWVGTVALLTLSAKVQVPMVPVPITLQTAVVLALPCLFGTRMALASIGSYLALGFMGAPVFALGAAAGPAYFMGPTAGYLAGFMLAASLCGKIFEARKLNVAALFGLMTVGHAVLLGTGVLWLAYGFPSLGLHAAIASGLLPFLAGTVLKSAMAAAFVKAFRK